MDHPVHFRRCHICGTLNANEDGRVEKCQHCNKPLSQFFYFNDRFVAVQGDTTLRPPLFEGEYYPVQGLTVYWEAC